MTTLAKYLREEGLREVRPNKANKGLSYVRPLLTDNGDVFDSLCYSNIFNKNFLD